MRDLTVLNGSEAIVRGAIESGTRIISGYPGYPITGIMECAKNSGIADLHVEWAPNEKVALETVLGTSVAGFRGMAVMKQVGMNVAADALMSSGIWRVRGGVVVVAGDDPNCDGSPVEQDSRCYGYIAHVPVLEPRTPEEARQMVKAAFAASEKFNLPVIMRFTKEFIAMKGEVETGDISQPQVVVSKGGLATFCGLWTDPVKSHYLNHEKMEAFSADLAKFNSHEKNGNLGIITGGYVSNLVASALKQIDSGNRVSVLRLGLIPTPNRIIEEFLNGIDHVLIIEVGEPIIEQQVRMISSKPILGKITGHVSYAGQIQIQDVVKAVEKFINKPDDKESGSAVPTFRKVIGRPFFGDMKGDPVMCPGCPGIGLHYSLRQIKKKTDLLAFCDNGCVSLGGLRPYETLDYTNSMGGTTGAAHGACIGGKKGVGVIGDSAFMHSGIPGLINMVNNGSKATIIIFDNLATAMTGRQPNPATGMTIDGRKTKRILIEEICRACGVEDVLIVDPYNLEECQKAIEKAVMSEEVSVVIARRECALLPGINYGRAKVDAQKCNLCMDCINKIGCPAISQNEDRIAIDEKCIGCMICSQLCPEGAIYNLETHDYKI